MDIPALKGLQVHLSRLHEILGAPVVNGDVEQDWSDLEQRTRLHLPRDYKEFVTAYGPGCINEQLYVFHPRAEEGGDGLHLETLWSQASYAYSELSRSNPEMYPYPVYPASNGCIPVARSISGNHVFLAPPGSVTSLSSRWSVVVDMGQWVHLDITFVDFLWQALRGELQVPLIDGEPSFQPLGTVGL
ncbi:hypothetical protein [Streptomyces sp. NPDC003487]